MIKIEKIDPHSVKWSGRIAIPEEIKILYKTLREMKIGETIKVTFSVPYKNITRRLGANFRKSRVDFAVITKKLDKEGKVWALRKVIRQ